MQDQYGVSTGVNETDRDGNGIRVNARYFMQIFDTKKGKSLQREQQINIQQPLQYFFSFNFDRKIRTLAFKQSQKFNFEFSKSLAKDLNPESTYRLFPFA